MTRKIHPILPPGERDYSSVRFGYAMNQQAVTFVLGEEWEWDEVGAPTNYQLNFAREFRYDGARARYLNRDLDTDDLLLSTPQFTSLSETWSDYDGDVIHGDFTASGASFTEQAAYEPGIGRILDRAGTPTTGYYHANHLGTTGTITDSLGANDGFRIITAFGEPLSGPSDRFGFAGAWSYQTTLDGGSPESPLFPFQHVGARYYDPANGRFLQRDPIGIRGGLNVYEYVRSAPTASVDPSGLGFFGDLLDVITKIIEDALGISPPASALRGPIKTVSEAMACGPDIARITIAKRHRDRLIDDEGDLMDALDRFDQGRNGHVKPGSGPAG